MIKKYVVMILFITAVGLLGGCQSDNNQDIGKDQAQQIAFEDADVAESDISQLHVSKDNDDGKTVYEIKFTDTLSGTVYDYEILASDGTIQKVDRENGTTQPSATQQNQNNQPTKTQNQNGAQTNLQTQNNSQTQTKNQNNSQTQVAVSLEDAKQMALDRVSGAADNNIWIELDYDDGHYIYEGEILYEQKEYEFEIDANTGTFLEWSEERR